MNDEEIRLIKGYFNDGYCCDLDELKNIANKIIKENNKLQSNWNSLREYIGEEWYCFDNESVECEVAKNILDKMNELEGREDEKI